MNSIFGLTSVRDEPYLTQVFSFVLNADKGYCNFLIRDILKLPSAGEVKEIIPEDSTAIGIPDIRILCEELDIVIEIKIGADFTHKQIERYNDISSHVFLIYKFLKDPEQANYAENVYTWYYIYSRTKKYIEGLPNSYDVAKKYLLEQFNLYLEETNMAIEKVSWEILNGTKSLLNLGAQISESLERLLGTQKIINYVRAGATPDYTGWRVYLVKGLIFYIYIIYNPLFVMSCFISKDYKIVSESKLIDLKDAHPELGWGGYWHLETLDISKNYFLCLSVDEQIDTIIKFIEDSKDKIVMQVDKPD